jgi:hypothetical protein
MRRWFVCFSPAAALSALTLVLSCGGDDANSSLAPGPEAAVGDAPTQSDALGNDMGVSDDDSGSVDAEAGSDAGMDATGAVDAEGGAEASSEAVTDADASASCIERIFGDHYLRTDGKLIYQSAPGLHTVITSGSSPLLGISEVVQQGNDHACGLKSDQTVWCWALSTSGGNAYGDLGNGLIGGPNAGVGVASQVVTNSADAGSPANLTGVVHLSSGPSDSAPISTTSPTCAIKSDNTVWCWGCSTAQGASNDGLFWGTTGSVANVPYAIPMTGAAGPAPMLANRVAVGNRHACLLLNGNVSCWGQNIIGNLADGDPSLRFMAYPVPVVTGYALPPTVDAIGSGADYSCALGGGSVWCWGNKTEVGNPSVAAVACGGNLCYPQPTPVQATALDGGSTQVPDAGPNQNPLLGVTSLVVAVSYACALDTSGSVWCWGNAASGTVFPLATPSTLLPYTKVTQITASGFPAKNGLRYLTASGVYVVGPQAVTPYCQ